MAVSNNSAKSDQNSFLITNSKTPMSKLLIYRNINHNFPPFPNDYRSSGFCTSILSSPPFLSTCPLHPDLLTSCRLCVLLCNTFSSGIAFHEATCNSVQFSATHTHTNNLFQFSCTFSDSFCASLLVLLFLCTFFFSYLAFSPSFSRD